ncbi:MAG: DegT/DnrJ/EryC1/StrS family aminotransferase [Syntrophomonadaceae bacterium]|nr:DegT/DnrJ/EryC1/StrS family aminotransferase [Syntrophomonadaceae bacterium]
MIKVSQGCLGEEELQEVKEAFEYGYFGHAYKVEQFEEALKQYLGVANAVAVNNGTNALHLAMDALGIGPGDEVIVPSLTFVASFQAVSATGAKPVSCDVYPDTLLIDIDDVKKRITSRTRAIMPVHYAGNPCDMDKLLALKAEHGIRIIEDAAHALGSEYQGKKVGGFGDISCFSFDSIKNISCGEGGAVICQDTEYAEVLRVKRTLGIERKPGGERWQYEVSEQGFRYHMSNINAAIGLAQLKKLNSFVDRRREICRKYVQAFQNIPGIGLLRTNYNEVAPHVFVILVKDGLRNGLMSFLRDHEIETGLNYIPNHLHPYYNSGYSLPATEKAYDEILTIPLHCRMTDNDVDEVIVRIQEFFNGRG